jgi:hypothetical protein
MEEHKELDDMNETEIFEILAQHGLVDGRKNQDVDIKTMYRGIRCMESFYLFHKVINCLVDISSFRKANFVKHAQEYLSTDTLKGPSWY